MSAHFSHDQVGLTDVANLQYPFVFDVDVVGGDSLVHNAPLVDVVDSHCQLQKAIKGTFRVQISIFVGKEALRDPVPQSASLELFQEYQQLSMVHLYFEGLSHVNMVADLNPFPHSVLHDFLFLLVYYFFVLLHT